MPEKGKAYEAVLALVFGLVLLAWLHGHPFWLPFTAILVLATLISSWLARAVAWAWLKLASGLGFIVSRILLSAIYFLILTPLALVQRMLGKNPIRSTQANARSNFVVRTHKFTGSDLKQPW